MLGKVEICGVNTSKLKVLKNDEMMALMVRAKQGDKAAKDALVEGNLRLVLSVIQRFSSSGENPDDLFQVGCIGLLKAIENFDLGLNVKFSTYGVPMVYVRRESEEILEMEGVFRVRLISEGAGCGNRSSKSAAGQCVPSGRCCFTGKDKKRSPAGLDQGKHRGSTKGLGTESWLPANRPIPPGA
jgi:hypothetical protein